MMSTIWRKGKSRGFCLVTWAGRRRVPSGGPARYPPRQLDAGDFEAGDGGQLDVVRRFLTENWTPSGMFFRLEKVYRRLSSMLGMYMGDS